MLDKIKSKFKEVKFVLVLGIGGSDLASKAVWSAMTLHNKSEKQAFFLEAPDAREYQEIENLVADQVSKLEEVVIITISKSGETTETLETFERVTEIFSKKFGSFITDRMLVISTRESSLWQSAERQNIECLEWEGDIGGRFSAFTIAHTTALTILGLDTESFLAGQHRANLDGAEHLAKEIFEYYKKDFKILDFFFFNSELEDLGKWCRQLVAESLSLITPTVSMGPVDLHSMLELYLGGPKERFTVFVVSHEEIENSPNEQAFENVSRAYNEAGLPFMKYEIKKINEKEIGEFMAFMMRVVIELAKLLEIDPYDQPAVENYKKSLRNQ